MVKPSSPRFFYGYIIVASSFFIILVMHGAYAAYGVFFNPWQTEFGWGRTVISGAYSLAFFLQGLFAIGAGYLTDRLGPKITMVVSGFILGLGFLLLSQANTIWELFLFYGVLVGIGTSSGNVTTLSTTARWFVKRRGIMSAIVKVGTGAGMFIVPLVASWMVLSYGWRYSYFIMGVVSVVGIIAVAQLLKRDPSQKGLEPYGAREVLTGDSSLQDEGFSFQEAIRTKQFWMVCAAYFFTWYSAMTITVHVVPHAVDLEISATAAVGVLSTIGGVSILGRLVMGGAGDRVGNRRALAICFIILVAAFSWLQIARELWALYLFAVIYGFSHGGFFALVSPLVAELFGTRSHGSIFGMVLFISQTGGALGPVVAGRVFDVNGGYQIVFMVLLVSSVIGLIVSVLLRPVRARDSYST